ncbi:hypothetical protein B0H13DRAFT_2087316 [Mycena leptocephala]|nr:hypothetical protein B0H13DRAFT_2087316 [Mycena leptocephala]
MNTFSTFAALACLLVLASAGEIGGKCHGSGTTLSPTLICYVQSGGRAGELSGGDAFSRLNELRHHLHRPTRPVR